MDAFPHRMIATAARRLTGRGARRPGLLTAVAVGALMTLAPLASPRAADITPEQKQAFEKIVHDYIVQHPEVLQEAMVELEKRREQAQQAAQKSAFESEKTALIDGPGAIVIGNPKGDVTLVEFFDYNCGYCKLAVSHLIELTKHDPNLRVVLRDFPVLGPDSEAASRVAVAARNQIEGDKYFEFHNKLMTSRGRVGKDRALAVAKEMGLDTNKLSQDAASPDAQKAINETLRLGDKFSLTGTPSFVVGDEVISGAVGVEPLRKAVTAVRQCGKATC